MLNNGKTVTVELITETNDIKSSCESHVSNPINENSSEYDKLSKMVTKILNEEFPKMKNNSLLHNIVLYNLIEKMKTVQTVENVLSYIRNNNAKEIQDVTFKNGEIYIKCSI